MRIGEHVSTSSVRTDGSNAKITVLFLFPGDIYLHDTKKS